MMQIAPRPAPTKAPAAPARERLTLAKVTKGVLDDPYRLVLYGIEGVGKTTFAAGAPAPLFIATERGTSRLDVARITVDRWEHIIDVLDDLEASQHEFRTVVLDTVDWAEPLAVKFICRRDSKATLEKYGYGKGVDVLRDELRLLLSRLERLSLLKGMHVVLLAHAHRKRFSNPRGEDYDRYQLKLSEKSAEIVREWPEAVLFAAHEDLTLVDKNNDKRFRAVSTGERVLYTAHHAACDAKNRYNLPESLDLSWEAFEAAARHGQSSEGLRAAFEEPLTHVDDATRATVTAWIAKVGDDARVLAQGLNKLRVKVAQQMQQQAAQAQTNGTDQEVAQ